MLGAGMVVHARQPFQRRHHDTPTIAQVMELGGDARSGDLAGSAMRDPSMAEHRAGLR
jgi:hypothetical protein